MNRLGIAGCIAATCALLACGVYLWFLAPPQSSPTILANPDSNAAAPVVAGAPGSGAPQDARPPGVNGRGGGNQPGSAAARVGRDPNATAGGPPGFRPGNDPVAMPRNRGPGRDALAEGLATLAMASLSPDFDLTNEQKQKIQAIADEATAAAKWRADHADELRKLDEDMRNARQDGQREELELLTQKQQDLLAAVPKAEDLAAKLNAVLTPEQLKTTNTIAAEKRAADDQRRRQVFGG
ncbi:MAG: hypothetical protein ABSH20_03490, partial [Tepidisphaeraceae bacterium]